jgi:transcriptional regulator with XRE-family HTH domain
MGLQTGQGGRTTVLRRWREDRCSLRSMAQKLGTTPRYLSELERGLRTGGPRIRRKLEDEFGLPANLLLLTVDDEEDGRA